MNKKLWAALLLVVTVSTATLCIGWGSKTRTTDDLIKIVAAGGSLVLDASGKDPNELVKVAAMASSGTATLHLKNCGGFETDDLVKIALAGSGHVVIEL